MHTVTGDVVKWTKGQKNMSEENHIKEKLVQ